MHVERYRVQFQNGFILQWDLPSGTSDRDRLDLVLSHFTRAGGVRFGATSITFAKGIATLASLTETISNLLRSDESAWLIHCDGTSIKVYLFAHPNKTEILRLV